MKLGNEFKRVLTGVMTAAMIFTSVPAAPVMAAAPADVLVESDDLQDISLEDGSEVLAESAEETLSEAPVAEEVLAEDVTEEAVPEITPEVDGSAIVETPEQVESEQMTFEALSAEKLADGTPMKKSLELIQDKVVTTVSENGDYTVTINADLNKLPKYASSNADQRTTYGATKWIGILIDTKLDSVTNVSWNGTGDANKLTEQEEADVKNWYGYTKGEEKGKFILWLRADDKENGLLSEGGRTCKMYVGEEERTINFKFVDTPEAISPKVELLSAEKVSFDENFRNNQENLSINKVDGNYVISGDFDELKAYKSSDDYQKTTFGATNWVGILIDSGEGDITSVSYNGQGLGASEETDVVRYYVGDENDAADTNLSSEKVYYDKSSEDASKWLNKENKYDYRGKFILWLRIDGKQTPEGKSKGLLLESKTITLNVKGKEPVSFNISYENTGETKYHTGKLHVDVLSQNTVNGETVSIDKISVKFGAHNYGEGGVDEKEYTVSNNKGIDIDYIYAKDVQIKVSGTDNYKGKYEYKVGTEQVKHNAYPTSINLKDENTEIKIEPVQVKFDTEVKATITSNNKIKSFNYKFDNDESATTYNISQNTVTFSKDGAQSITLSGFTKAEGVDEDSYYIVVTADGKEVKESSGSYTIPIKGTSVAVTVTAIPKVKVTISFNGVKNKFSISGMTAIVEGEESPVGLESKFGDKEYASFYVKNGKTVSVDKVDGKAGYDFAKMTGAEISEDGTKWELGAITVDKLFTIDKVQYALSQNIVISDGHNYPISVSLDEITGAVETVDGRKLFKKNSEDLTVTVKTVYDKEKDNNYYELPKKDSKYSLKYVLRSGSAVDVMATRNSSDLGKYTVTIPVNAIIELFEAGKVLSLKTELQKYVHDYELTFTSNPDGSATAEGYVNGKEVITLTGSGNVKKDIAYGSKVGITAKAAPGYVLKSVSINVAPHGTVTQNQVTVIKSTDKDFADISLLLKLIRKSSSNPRRNILQQLSTRIQKSLRRIRRVYIR